MSSSKNTNPTRGQPADDIVPAELVHFHWDKTANLTQTVSDNKTTTCNCKQLQTANTLLLIGHFLWSILAIVVVIIFCLMCKRRPCKNAFRRKKKRATEKNDDESFEMVAMLPREDADDGLEQCQPGPSSASANILSSSPSSAVCTACTGTSDSCEACTSPTNDAGKTVVCVETTITSTDEEVSVEKSLSSDDDVTSQTSNRPLISPKGREGDNTRVRLSSIPSMDVADAPETDV